MSGSDLFDLERKLTGEGIRLIPGAELRPYLTLRIGGKARMLAILRNESQMYAACLACRDNGLLLVVLGGGSNLAFADGTGEFLVGINQVGGIEERDGNRLCVGSGIRIGVLVSACLERGLGGVEFMAGIPGSVGGAAVVNAGAFGRSFSEVLIEASIINAEGESRTVGPDFFKYSYRQSALKLSTQVITRVTLQLKPDKKVEIRRRVSECRGYRQENHPPYTLATAGCFFKNPVVSGQKMSAGKLIEECGLKGKSFGPILVSERHANFLINTGGATFDQLLEAEEAIRARVLQATGIRLEREVVYVSRRGEKR